MADKSNIGWTDATWPIVQGCDPVDSGCANCYSVFDVWRQQNHPNPKISAPIAGAVQKDERGILSWTGKVACREDRLDWPLKWREPRMIFVPSLGDLFHPAVPDDFIDKVFAVMALTPQHTYQVLSRRSKRAREYCSDPETPGRVVDAALRMRELPRNWAWPLPNVWLGASVPDQARAGRLYDLLATPAALHFVSYEPALEFVDFTQIEIADDAGHRQRLNAFDGWISTEMGGGMWSHNPSTLKGLGWGIIGGESIRRKGKAARPFDLDWARRTISDFQRNGVPLFVKQLGHNPVDSGLWVEGDAPAVSRPRGKGTDPAEWPEELRVQQFPEVRP